MCTIVTKSLRGFLNQISIEYYKLEIVDKDVIETELSPQEANELIKDMEELHRIDHNHIIWGDKEFKTKCPDHFRFKVETHCPKEIKLCGIDIFYKTHDLIIKKDHPVMNTLRRYLDEQFSLLYQNLGKEVKADYKNIYFKDFVFNYEKFNNYNKLLVKIYNNKSFNMDKFSNVDLDILLYALYDFGIEPDLIDKINDEIEKRINNGIYDS